MIDKDKFEQVEQIVAFDATDCNEWIKHRALISMLASIGSVLCEIRDAIRAAR